MTQDKEISIAMKLLKSSAIGTIEYEAAVYILNKYAGVGLARTPLELTAANTLPSIGLFGVFTLGNLVSQL